MKESHQADQKRTATASNEQQCGDQVGRLRRKELEQHSAAGDKRQRCSNIGEECALIGEAGSLQRKCVAYA